MRQAEIILSTNSRALEKPLWDFDIESVGQIADKVAAEPMVRSVSITDPTSMVSVLRLNPITTSTGPTQAISRDIIYAAPDGLRRLGVLTLRVNEIGLFSSLKETELAFISIFIFAVFAVVTAAIIGNRLMIITPLLRLTAAVDATRRLGSRPRVDWTSADEMGKLASSFNEMQTELEEEERELKVAHRRATDIYNLTPAMLFSIDHEDRITAVSEYWLAATGYRRGDVIGKPFIDMVDAGSQEIYLRRKENSGMIGSTWDVTIRFICADARLIDVLIHETRPPGKGPAERLSLSVMTDVSELKASEIRNRIQAITDHLTGLANRQGLEAALSDRIAEATASETELAVLFIDLDRFKWINDTLGHSTGDAVLRRFVELLLPLLGTGDFAARLGGDEFAILVPARHAESAALDLAHQINSIFAKPLAVASIEARLSASIGIAIFPQHADNPAELLQRADLAMYCKKHEGKNGALLFDASMMEQARGRAEVEGYIEAALRENWVEAYFQPIIDVGTRDVKGFEALMRVRHPQKGILPPGPIIDVAEETGSITRLGQRVMEQAIASLAQISDIPGMEDTYLAINFSPLQFERELPARILASLARHNIDPHRIVIEITEAVLMNANPEVATALGEITRCGCRVALDDFGTGYSSLSYLNRFPVDIVKIDQSFTRALTDSAPDIRQKSRMLIEGITAISHKMFCTVIAEGIETREQFEALKHMGVDCGQGYYFARPQPVDNLAETLSHARTILATEVA